MAQGCAFKKKLIKPITKGVGGGGTQQRGTENVVIER